MNLVKNIYKTLIKRSSNLFAQLFIKRFKVTFTNRISSIQFNYIMPSTSFTSFFRGNADYPRRSLQYPAGITELPDIDKKKLRRPTVESGPRISQSWQQIQCTRVRAILRWRASMVHWWFTMATTGLSGAAFNRNNKGNRDLALENKQLSSKLKSSPSFKL